eukprot:COSAG01_NODE_29816_length_628_cov_507.457467_1_plen_99_part_00
MGRPQTQAHLWGACRPSDLAESRTPHAIVAMGTTDRLARLGFPFTRPCVIKNDQRLYCTSVWKSWFHGVDHAVLISERIAATQTRACRLVGAENSKRP